ncbi:MAG: hypothetical protein KatS3mg054_0004 [Chloroflexus sp.]|nr:MAG: hypothetical protein KatS3mg054_0004 [Chloroflexus sp.]
MQKVMGLSFLELAAHIQRVYPWLSRNNQDWKQKMMLLVHLKEVYELAQLHKADKTTALYAAFALMFIDNTVHLTGVNTPGSQGIVRGWIQHQYGPADSESVQGAHITQTWMLESSYLDWRINQWIENYKRRQFTRSSRSAQAEISRALNLQRAFTELVCAAEEVPISLERC